MHAILQALGSGWQNMPDCSKTTVYSLPSWSCIASSLQTLMVAWALGQQQWESGERKSLPYSRLLQPLCPRAHKQVISAPISAPSAEHHQTVLGDPETSDARPEGPQNCRSQESPQSLQGTRWRLPIPPTAGLDMQARLPSRQLLKPLIPQQF